MASVNRAILVGNLGADPEMRYMPNGDAVCNIRLATTEAWKDKQSGEKKELTEWHRVVFYRKLAEIAGQYLKKGSQVYLEGRIRTRKWTDKEGQERYTTEIEANEMQMLGSPRTEGAGSAGRAAGQGGGVGNAEPPARERRPAPAFAGDTEDDIPFMDPAIQADPVFVKATARRRVV